MNISITPSMKLSALGSSISDKFAALHSMVDMVGESSTNHSLYCPCTGECLMESDEDSSAFSSALACMSPQEVVALTVKYHYGL